MKELKWKKWGAMSVLFLGIGGAFMFEHPMSVLGGTEPAEFAPSGIAKVEYQLSGAITQDWTPISVASATSTAGWDLTLTQKGITHMLVAATDKAGNVAMEVRAFNVGDDGTTAPSPIKNIKYKLSGATVQTWTNYSTPFTLTKEGRTTIDIQVEDMAGNIVTMQRLVKIDKSAPINNGVTITLQ